MTFTVLFMRRRHREWAFFLRARALEALRVPETGMQASHNNKQESVLQIGPQISSEKYRNRKTVFNLKDVLFCNNNDGLTFDWNVLIWHNYYRSHRIAVKQFSAAAKKWHFSFFQCKKAPLDDCRGHLQQNFFKGGFKLYNRLILSTFWWSFSFNLTTAAKVRNKVILWPMTVLELQINYT